MLRRFYDDLLHDDPIYELTPDAALLLRWLQELDQHEFVKSTLVDALTTLLVRNDRITYNKAAGSEKRERNLKSYVLGAFKGEKLETSHRSKAVYHRNPAATHTVLLAHFTNQSTNQIVTLAQVFWVPDLTDSPLYVEEPLVKIRFLDESLRIHPALSHVSVWLSEFRALNLAGSRVFIIENLTSFLTFPNLSDSLAIWGGGFAVTWLGGTDWLLDKQLYYWGDLDPHGFQILDRCRKLFPKPQSLLMDRTTFDAHQTSLPKANRYRKRNYFT